MMAQSRTLCLVLVAWVLAVVLLVGHTEGVKKREKGAARGRPRAEGGAGGAGGGKGGVELDVGGIQNLEQFAAAFEAGAWDSQIFGGGGVVGQGCAPDNPYQQPFKPETRLKFCTQYQSFGCCDSRLDEEIKKVVDGLVSKKCKSCYAMLKQVKCAECAPDALLFHEGKNSSIKFCESYCHELFNACKDIPLGQQDDPIYLNGWGTTAKEWCEGKVAQEPFCFRGAVGKPFKPDTKCLCPSHKCHLNRSTTAGGTNNNNKKVTTKQKAEEEEHSRASSATAAQQGRVGERILKASIEEQLSAEQ